MYRSFLPLITTAIFWLDEGWWLIPGFGVPVQTVLIPVVTFTTKKCWREVGPDSWLSGGGPNCVTPRCFFINLAFVGVG